MKGMMQLDSADALGLIMHAASEVEGLTQVAQVGHSEEYTHRFDAELERLLIAVGAPPPIEDTIFEPHRLVTP